MDEVLSALAGWRIKSGIVTNKAGLAHRAVAGGIGTALALRLRRQRRYAGGAQAASGSR